MKPGAMALSYLPFWIRHHTIHTVWNNLNLRKGVSNREFT